MRKIFIIILLFMIIIGFGNEPLQAERNYVNIETASALLDLMDEVAAGKVKTKEQILIHLNNIYNTEGYRKVCQHQNYNPRQNKMMNRIYYVCDSIINDKIDQLSGRELYYYEIYQHRDQYRDFINRFKGWEPATSALNKTYSYFPKKITFTGTIYFTMDGRSDAYTLNSDIIISIYQIKKMIEERGMDFNKELIPHEFHHILTKQLLFKKYGEQLKDSTALPYFLGYIMLEGYAVEATADKNTKNGVYMMKRSEEQIYNLFKDIEKVITDKNKYPDRSWRSIYRDYFSKMIDIYTVGTTMVQAIEGRFGKEVLVNTLENPPGFFKLYQNAATDDDKLYKFSDQVMNIISESFMK